MTDGVIHDEALGEILLLYQQARQRADDAAPIEAADRITDTCRYCARPWQRWESSRLDGHAACVVTDEFKLQLAEKLMYRPDISLVQVARTLDVSKNVVRAWHQVGMSRLSKKPEPTKKRPVVPIRAWEQVPDRNDK